ncbi:hypothetical protein J6590_076686 [Homalodisca vitripennis]|nr:hypothetical protein J6590_076686 [Homalodisca vitripennis]
MSGKRWTHVPAIVGGSEVTFKLLDTRLSVRELVYRAVGHKTKLRYLPETFSPAADLLKASCVRRKQKLTSETNKIAKSHGGKEARPQGGTGQMSGVTRDHKLPNIEACQPDTGSC